MLSSIIFYQAPSPSYMQPWASQISTRTINGLILNLHLHLSSVSSSFIKIFILIFLHQFLLPSSVSSSCVNASVFLFITSTPTDQCQDRACPPLQRHLPARKPPLLRCLQRPWAQRMQYIQVGKVTPTIFPSPKLCHQGENEEWEFCVSGLCTVQCQGRLGKFFYYLSTAG